MRTSHDVTPPTPPLPEYIEHSLRIPFGGDHLDIYELSVGQVIQLSAHANCIAQLDFSNIPALFKQNSDQMVELLSIALAVPKERVLAARSSQLIEALAAVISLNKEFFLQAVQTVVQAHALKATVQAQIEAAAQRAGLRAQKPPYQPMPGQMASPPSSPSATASAISSPIAGANTSPTSLRQTDTPSRAPESSSSSPE